MQITGTVISATSSKQIEKKDKSGYYEGWELIYEDLNTKEIKPIVRPSQTLTQVPGLKDALTALVPGDKFVCTMEKDGSFFKVTGLNKGELATMLPSPTGGYKKPFSGGATTNREYETKEERALRQRLIVRQSSVSTAVSAYAGVGRPIVDEDAIFALAAKIDAFVWKDLK